MTTRPTSVASALQLHLLAPGAAPLPVRADLRYDAADPYAVQVCFYTRAASSDETVMWTFARSLLSDGLTAPCGQGDVQVWPSTSAGADVVCLSLSSPSGRAMFEVPRVELGAFLERTYESVPRGEETGVVDVDAELALLLWAQPEA